MSRQVVTETVSEQVPVQQYRYVQETKTRRIPVVSHRMEYETRKQPVEVQYYEPETVTRPVTVTRQVQRMVPVERTVMVQRPVLQAVQPAYYDSFGAAISSGYSSLMPGVASYSYPAIGSSVVESAKPAIADEEEADQTPKTTLEGVDSKKVDGAEESPSDSGSDDPADDAPTGTPGLTSPANGPEGDDLST